MVVRNKVYRIIDKYREVLTKQMFGGKRQTKAGNRSKNEVLDFFLSNGRWPSKLSKSKKEKSLAARFENYVAKESAGYDKNMRRIAMATGRTTNKKRKHNVKGFKKEILEFIKEYGHVPNVRKGETIEGEGRLRDKLEYYTFEKGNDMTFLGQVYSLDPCHRSGVPMKFRALINESLDVEKPLIRLV